MNMHRLYGWISPFFRRRRMRKFHQLLQVSRQDRVLDLGGYPWAWPAEFKPEHITLLNLSFPVEAQTQGGGFQLIAGDACATPFRDGEFDVVFSNSVIEHLGTWERQLRFAEEARRTGRRLWVQTPAYEFLIEPHLIAPAIHWLPVGWRRRLIRNVTVWGWLTRPNVAQVETFLGEVRLLRREEMRQLFPDCEIREEKFLGLTKSYIAVRRA